jgi:hypothetical protein
MHRNGCSCRNAALAQATAQRAGGSERGKRCGSYATLGCGGPHPPRRKAECLRYLVRKSCGRGSETITRNSVPAATSFASLVILRINFACTSLFPTVPSLRIKRRGNAKVVTDAPPNEISVQLQPCEVPHSVQTPHAPVRMTLVLPQCEQLIPMYIFSRAARTRSACN